MSHNTNYMFDTTAFNDVVKGNVPVELLIGQKIYTTHVQWDEINNTKNPELKDALIEGFIDICPISISTESAAWGVSKWNKAKWTTDNICKQITSDLNRLKRHRNNKKDTLIAETAIKHEFTLVTNDKDLSAVTLDHGGTCINFEHFMRITNDEREP